MDCVAESLGGERRTVLDPSVRSSRFVIDELLHPDFAERRQSAASGGAGNAATR
jgi:hypothetical protein